METIEVTLTYDLRPDIDEEAYWNFAGKAAATLLSAPQLLELRAHRHLLTRSLVRATAVWADSSGWASFAQSSDWREIEKELNRFGSDLQISVWSNSPWIREPLHP